MLIVQDQDLSIYERMYKSMADNGIEERPGTQKEIVSGYAELVIGASVVKIRQSRVRGQSFVGTRGGAGRFIGGFSVASRRRLMRMIASIERDARPLFVTLTYPDLFTDDFEVWKRDLDVIGKRMRRKFPEAGLVWRVEFQERKSGSSKGKVAPHFHLLVYGVGMYEFRQWVGLSWYEVVGSRSKDHLRAGTSTERLRSFRGTMYYVSKYIAKVAQPPSFWKGRFWGVIGRLNLPFGLVVKIKIADFVAVKAIRLGRKMLGMRGKVLRFGMTWIMNSERMLDYLEFAAVQGQSAAVVYP